MSAKPKDEKLLRRVLAVFQPMADEQCGNAYTVGDCPGCQGHQLITDIRERLGEPIPKEYRKKKTKGGVMCFLCRLFSRKPKSAPPRPMVTIGVPSDEWLEWMLEELEERERNEKVDKVRP
jgi:hypothetical protein